MAPVIDNRAAVEHATGIAQQTLVIVESIKVKDGARVRYQSCNGFILHALEGRVYVAAPKGKLAGDIISVRFQNNVEGDAKLCGIVLEFSILEIVVAGNFERVNIGNLPRDRTDVVILAQAKMEDELQFSIYTSSVIIPNNETLPARKNTRLPAFQSPDFFTIGFTANMEIHHIIGAPVFDLHGIFLGIIHSCQKDMVFVRSSHFIPEERRRIEMNEI